MEDFEQAPEALKSKGSSTQGAAAATHDIPELVSQVYRQAPAPLRVKLLECLLRPVGPLALLVIAAGAFARFLDRLRRDAVPISIDDAARITSAHVLELARYVQQSSPDALVRLGHLLAHQAPNFATLSGSALLMALSILQKRSASDSLESLPPRQPAP